MSIVSTIGPIGPKSIEAFRRRAFALKALSNDEVEQLVAVAKQSVETIVVQIEALCADELAKEPT